MDKTSRALFCAEDNAAAIESIRAELKRSKGASVRLVNGVSSNSTVTFGTVSSKNGAIVLVAFDGSVSTGLLFNGVAVSSGVSPIFAELPAGSGELVLNGARTNGKAVIFEM